MRSSEDFVVERIGDAFLTLRVADVPVSKLEVRSVMGYEARDVERADFVVVIGSPVVLPDKYACDPHRWSTYSSFRERQTDSGCSPLVHVSREVIP